MKSRSVNDPPPHSTSFIAKKAESEWAPRRHPPEEALDEWLDLHRTTHPLDDEGRRRCDPGGDGRRGERRPRHPDRRI